MPGPWSIGDDYYSAIARIESSNDPYARARTSTASGLYQFTRSTWEGLGGTWGGQSGQAFGGLRPSVAQQNQMIQRFTNNNAAYLDRNGIPVNNVNLYTAHFLGAGGARDLLRASPNTPLSQVTTAAQRRANPSVLGSGTVGSFLNFVQRKLGDGPFTIGRGASPNQSAPGNGGFSLFGDGGMIDSMTISPMESMGHIENAAGSILASLGDPAKRIGFVIFGVIIVGISIFVILKGPAFVMGAVTAGVSGGKSLITGAAMEAVA